MTTHEVKLAVRKILKRPIGIEELYQIANEIGKVMPLKTSRTGSVTYRWDESEIPIVIAKLKDN